MAARTIYPAPDCPKCKESESTVKNTYYTKDGRILRMRRCSWCGHRWWSLQQPEESLDTTRYRIKMPPKFTRAYNKKSVEILSNDN